MLGALAQGAPLGFSRSTSLRNGQGASPFVFDVLPLKEGLWAVSFSVGPEHCLTGKLTGRFVYRALHHAL